MTNADRPFINNATRKEREDLLREAQLPTSYHKLAGLDDTLGGRYRVKETISGEQAATQYPKQDSASPWSGGGAQVPPEEPLNFDVTAVDPVGEQFEIQRSITEQLVDPDLVHTQSRVDQQSTLVSAVEGSGPPPKLAASSDAPTANSLGAVVEIDDAAIPPDGLDDVPRRADGFPMSSHAIKPRRKLK
jgi:hypothetical protein